MTILLSCLPSAITVTLVYLIVKKLTSKTPIAITSSLVLLGSAVFLTQATVLEEYAIAVMLLTVGVYFLIENKLRTGFIFLGLATAIHIVVLVITGLIWIGYAYKWNFLRTRTGWKELINLGLIFFIFGVLPYSLILLLMYLDTPRLMAGGFDWYHINGYFFGIGKGIVGTISVFDFPHRLLSGLRILIVSLGFAIIPLVYFLKDLRSVKKPGSLSGMTKYLLLAPAGFGLWYYLTCFDPGTWTFMLFGFPLIVVMIGIGLSKLSSNQVKLVALSAVVLIVTNGFLLNANKLAHDEPFASTYYQEVWALPDGSAIVIGPGAFSMTTIYAMTEGKDIVPLVWQVVEYGFKGYQQYLSDTWGVQGNTIAQLAEDAQNDGREIYIAFHEPDEEVDCFEWTPIPGNKFVKKIVGFTGFEPEYLSAEGPIIEGEAPTASDYLPLLAILVVISAAILLRKRIKEIYGKLRNPWCTRALWVVYVALIGLSYYPVKALFIAQEPVVWVTKASLTMNVILLFMAWGASCPIIAKKLNKPVWFGYAIMTPVFLALIFFLSLFGLETRW